MYKYGEPVSSVESELIHGLREITEKIDYMNWRMQGACINCIRSGGVAGEIDLVQFE